MPTEILVDANSAVVSSGGTTAPSAGTVETWTVTTASNWPVLLSGRQFRVIDKADLGKTSGYEIMLVTANANGSSVSWTATRGGESTTPYAHSSGWTAVPAATAAAVTSAIWSNSTLVNGVLEFGIDNTGTVADNSTALNAALQAGAQGGYGIFIPVPSPNTPAVVNIQNPTLLGAGSSSVFSPYQGGRLVGAGYPGMYAMQTATAFQQGLCTINWNGAAGGTMLEVLGGVQGWGLEHLYFHGGATPAATGLSLTGAGWGEAKDITLDACSSALITESPNVGTFPMSTLHNRWRGIQLVVPSGCVGWQLGAVYNTDANVCFEDIDEVSFILPNGASASTMAFQLAACDTCRIRNVHIADVSSATNITAIWVQVQANGLWPTENIIENIDFGTLVGNGGVAVGKHGGAQTASVALTIRTIANDNGNTPNPCNVSGGMSNIVWERPGRPTGVITGSPLTFTSGTAWTNVYGVPVTVYLTGGTITAVSIGGSSLGTGAAALTGPWRVSLNQTITFTGTGTITADVIGD